MQDQPDYDGCFLSASGQDVLEDMKERFFFLNTTMVPGDPMATAYNEGMRAALLYVLSKLSEPTNLSELSAEMKKRKHARVRELVKGTQI